MKIEKIQLKNIGPYVNYNEFNFNISDSVKRMVLIGGKNGAGKTTLFNAIKICLYGCVVFGFETNNTRYYEEVEKIINTNEKLKKVGESEVVIDLLLDDGKDDHVYTFDRLWKVKGNKIIENFTLSKDGEIVSETEKSDFESFLLQTLPPNLFKFYFFDGEKISDFIFDGNKSTDFKEAFLKLCNLDTMEIIRDNFRRISRNKSKDGLDISKEYEKCLSDDNLLAERITSAEEDYREIASEIAVIDDQLASLEKVYTKSGGISKKEWRSMEDRIAKEETRRKEKRKWLKDIADNVLPFVILQPQLEALKDQIMIEHKAQIDANVKSTIDTPAIKSIIANVLDMSGIELYNTITNKIIYEIVDYTNETASVTPILNLSDFDRFELTSKINSLLAFDVSRIKTATDEIEASLNHVKRIRKKMERSSIESYEGYLQSKSNLNEEKVEKTMTLVRIDAELQKYRADKAVSAAKLAKAKASYEAVLKKQSINDISARALLAFDELQTVLYEKSIRKVEEGFQRYFNSLINKSDLIDGIHIDSNLNVLPYKNKTFDTSELKKIINKNGSEYVIAQIGLHAYEILQEKMSAGEQEIVLPVEVKQRLSAGEKQIFIMALYQALSQLNKIDVPYIVDTPFARIDKEHRGKILEQFFKQLNGQVIILSTDEEIVGDYCNVISDIVSNTFVLNHTINGNTEILSDTYFGGSI
mgnify:CR=1 FL=1